MIVTTNTETAVHNEVKSETCLDGFKCSAPLILTCSDSGFFKTWLQCNYDLSQVKEIADGECKRPRFVKSETERGNGATGVLNRAKLGEIRQKVRVNNSGQYQHGSGHVVSISVVPPCDDLILIGDTSRPLPCKMNPVRVVVQPSDTQVILRAKGYLPKTIELRNITANQHVEVYLDTSD